jgi:hypothetical protein
MNCPNCQTKVNIWTQLSVAVHGVFICKSCSTKIEVKTTGARIFDWVIELVLFPAGLLLVFITDLSYLFMAVYLPSLFLMWFLIARLSIKKKLAFGHASTSNQ